MRLTDLGHPVLLPAAITPLVANGTAVDVGAIEGYGAFLEERGADGAFVCGTTGEGVLLSIAERQATAKGFRAALRGILVVHAGAQTTRSHGRRWPRMPRRSARTRWPSFRRRTFRSTPTRSPRISSPPPGPAARRRSTATHSRPAPAIPCRSRSCDASAAEVDNLAGLKVSESPFERVAPYLELGLPVLIGNEPLIPLGIAAGRDRLGLRHGGGGARSSSAPRSTIRRPRPPSAWPPSAPRSKAPASSSLPRSTCSPCGAWRFNLPCEARSAS